MTAAGALGFISLWQRFLQFEFYHQALAAGLGVALACGLLSVLVVYKRMAFVGEGISHAAFGGAGVALLLGLFLPAFRSPLTRDLVITLFCVATALLIGYLSRSGRLHEDSAIGICLVAAMALGVVLLNVRAYWLERLIGTGRLVRADIGYTPSFHDLLFGNILAVAGGRFLCFNAQAWAGILLGLVILVLFALAFRQLVFFAFDEESAAVFGLPTALYYYGLLVALGVAIALAMRLLGVILCTALLILPGASASFWSRRIVCISILSVVIAMGGVTAGLFAAIALEILSTGPVIVLMLFCIFLVSYIAGRLRRWRAQTAGKAMSSARA